MRIASVAMARRVSSLAPVAVLGWCLAACSPVTGEGDAARPSVGSVSPAGAALRFTDVTHTSGVDLVLVSGAVPARELIESIGAGLALIDYDNDGDFDLFAPNGATLDAPRRGAGCRLFANLGDMHFEDVTDAAGLEFAGWGMGVSVGDVDGNGFDDLYVTCFGPNVLLLNREGRFEDVTAEAGVGDDRWGTSSAFGDVDGDGDLDLYVVNYFHLDPERLPERANFKGVAVPRGPETMRAQADVLYANRGDGTFEDVTERAGCADPTPRYGLGVVMLDLDLDGRQEIFVGNDSDENFLFDDAEVDADVAAATEPGTQTPGAAWAGRVLADRGRLSGVALNGEGRDQATMGIAVGDVDGDGFPDLFTTNFSSDTNTLHVALDGRFYEDHTARFGLAAVSRRYLGWSTMFYDFDLDTDEDLLLVNGHVYAQATIKSMDSDAAQLPLLFAREGNRFRLVTDVGDNPWLAEPHCDRSAVFGDLDDDGDVDMVIGELSGPLRVLRNDSERAGPWLAVELRDERPGHGNHRGLGSRVEIATVRPGADAARQTRWIFSGGGYESASAPVAYFGLPPGTETVDLVVTWPDGATQREAAVTVDRRVVLERGTR